MQAYYMLYYISWVEQLFQEAAYILSCMDASDSAGLSIAPVVKKKKIDRGRGVAGITFFQI